MGNNPEQLPIRFGPFLLLRSLGAGGMGTAYLARHPQWKGFLVVKRLHQHFMEDETVFKRFIHEAKVATYVRHANVTPLVAMGTVGKEPFFATDFVFGISFSDLLDRIEYKKSEPIPYSLILRIAIGVSKGLEAIHQAVDIETGRSLELIHRDIGSRNVLLGFDGMPRIIDLGLGKSVFADWQTAAGIFAGSPDYMPPEQALGDKVDRRGDIYSLAITIWELIVGKKRIRESTVALRIARAVEATPEPVRTFRPEVSTHLESALQKCMEPSPEYRLAQVSDLRQALERELARTEKTPKREDVVAWLDTACATILAKDRRLISQLDELARDFNLQDADLQETEYLVAQPIIFMPTATQVQESEIGNPGQWTRFLAQAETKVEIFWKWWSNSSSFSRGALVGIMGLIFLLSILVIITQTGKTQTDAHKIENVNIPSPPKLITPVRKVSKPKIKAKLPVRTAKKRPRPARPSVEAMRPDDSVLKRRAGFVERIRRLRKKRFDVPWQKRLTRLSGMLSSSETKQALDRIEARLRVMEKEVE